MYNAGVSEKRLNEIRILKEKCERVLKACNETLENGQYERRICEDNGVDYAWFRRGHDVSMTNSSILESKSVKSFMAAAERNAAESVVSCDDHLWHDLIDTVGGGGRFGDWCCPFQDFRQRVDSAIDICLTDREAFVVLEYYYGDADGYEDVAKKLGVTRERIRQIIKKALRKLSSPRVLNYILVGDEWQQLQDGLANARVKMLERERGICKKRSELKALQNALEMTDEEFESEFQRYYGDGDLNHIHPITCVDFSVRTHNCLKRAGIRYLEELDGWTIGQVMKIRNLGRKSLNELLTVCMKYGIVIEMKEVI